MKKFIYCLEYIYTSIALGMVSILLLSQWTWLEMRISMGIIMPGVLVITYFIYRNFNFIRNYYFILLFQILILVLYIVIYDFELNALKLMPLIHLSEATYINFNTTLGFLAFVLIIISSNSTLLNRKRILVRGVNNERN